MALTPLPERLRGWRVVLGSASPRRRDILGLTRLPFEATPPSCPEDLDPAHFRNPRDYAVETARRKALDVGRGLRRGRGFLQRLVPALRKPTMVIAADTIVVLDGLILEKPKDEDDAVWMLTRLSGRQHSVITGVAVALYPGGDPGDPGDPDRGDPDGDPDVRTFWEETRVTFSPLSDAVVRDYVATGEPMDKAGAYGIQGLGAVLAERVEGDVLNAAGFPLNRFCRELAAIFPATPDPALTPDPGASTPDDPAAAAPAGDVIPGGGDGAEPSGVGGASGPAPAPGDDVTAWYVTRTGFPRGLLEVIDGFKNSQVLFAACRLGLFDLLSDSEPRGVAEVAARVGGAWALEEEEAGAEPGAGPSAAWVGSLMEACVGLGLLQRADGGFLAAPAARRHLRADSARPLRGYVRSLDRGGWADARALGRGPQRPRSPGSQADADAAELELEALMADEVLATFDLGRYRDVAQVGGGSLALRLARATPQAHVTPVGDPARDPLPPADLYVLGGLARAERDLDDLLRRVAAALRPGGAVLLTEGPTHRQPLSLLGSTFEPPTPPGGRGPRWSDPGPRAQLRRLGFRDVRVASPGRLPPAVLAARGDP